MNNRTNSKKKNQNFFEDFILCLWWITSQPQTIVILKS